MTELGRKEEGSHPEPGLACLNSPTTAIADCSSRSRSRSNADAPTVEQHCKVVAEEATGALKLKETDTKDELLIHDVNVNDFLMKSKFDNEYGCSQGRWCAGTAMWSQVALSFFAVLALVCSLRNVTPSVLGCSHSCSIRITHIRNSNRIGSFSSCR